MQHQVLFHLGPAGGSVSTERADHVRGVLLRAGSDVLREGRPLQVVPLAEGTGHVRAPHTVGPVWEHQHPHEIRLIREIHSKDHGFECVRDNVCEGHGERAIQRQRERDVNQSYSFAINNVVFGIEKLPMRQMIAACVSVCVGVRMCMCLFCVCM